MKPRHGQAALEYLLTYGWAVLAVLVGIGALVYFTNGFGAWAPDVCTFEPPFTCLEAKATSDGTILLGIQNGVEELGAVDLTLTCDDDSTVNYVEGSVPVNARLNGTLVHLACPPATGRFRGRIAIAYRASDESVWHTATGSAQLRVED